MRQCSSMEFHFRNANALGPDTVIYLLIYLCTYLPVPLCVCLLLIPPFFQSACLLRDLGLPHLPLSAPRTHCALAYMHASPSTHSSRKRMSRVSQARHCGALVQPFSLLLSAFEAQYSSLFARVSAPGASAICTLSPLVSERRGGAILEAAESDLIPTLAFCQQRLHSDERNGSSGQTDLLLNVSFGQTECEQDGSELCFSCQKRV